MAGARFLYTLNRYPAHPNVMSHPAPAPAQPPDANSHVLRLKRGEERRLACGHLWVFSNEVDSERTPLGQFAAGAVTELRSYRDAFLGYAYVNPHALICARILSRAAAQPVNAELIRQRLSAALTLRERVGDARHCRWVFGESDLLPGLVLDRYGDVVVGQIATAGMEALRAPIESAVRDVVQPQALIWKNDTAARDLEHLAREVHCAFGTQPRELSIIEAGLTFAAPLAEGQKTGWFYDQSGNRVRLRRYVPAGARVLDVCSYVGAWAVTALHQGAAQACCIDSSALALDFAAANASRNGNSIEPLRADAFDALKTLLAQGRQFDVVVLDPPAFIKRKKDIPQGQAAYRKLNQLALGLLADGGLLVSCSCSYHLAPEQLLEAIQAAARHTGRFVQILESGGQSPDHPLHPAIPETRYLKAFFCRVTRAVG
jgi:23S rRNA (cytosine1962-C5)-methyltransferase